MHLTYEISVDGCTRDQVETVLLLHDFRMCVAHDSNNHVQKRNLQEQSRK